MTLFQRLKQTNHKFRDVIELEGTQQVLWPEHCIQGTTGARFLGKSLCEVKKLDFAGYVSYYIENEA